MTDGEQRDRRWLTGWLRDESFWRDVTTRTLAILISGLIVYVLAVAGGYVRRPGVWPVLLTLGFLALLAASVFFNRLALDAVHRGDTSRRALLYTVPGWLVAVALAVFTVVSAVTGDEG